MWVSYWLQQNYARPPDRPSLMWKCCPLLSDPGAKGGARRGKPKAQGVMVISGVELQRAVRGLWRVVGAGSHLLRPVHTRSHCFFRGPCFPPPIPHPTCLPTAEPNSAPGKRTICCCLQSSHQVLLVLNKVAQAIQLWIIQSILSTSANSLRGYSFWFYISTSVNSC